MSVPDKPEPVLQRRRAPCHAHAEGFDLQAGVTVPARDRARLERLCRYALRPPIAADRVRRTEAGQVLLELRHRWSDGTTHLLFDPLELLERLAVLTRSAWRSRLGGGAAPAAPDPAVAPPAGPPPATRPRPNLRWAQLMARSFGLDVAACPRCGGRFESIALIETRAVIERIPEHLGLPTRYLRHCQRARLLCHLVAIAGAGAITIPRNPRW